MLGEGHAGSEDSGHQQFDFVDFSCALEVTTD